jgi:hypothetical protein
MSAGKTIGQQQRIDADPQPVTWDGEPVWSPDTIREQPGLFSPEAFEQMPGQLALEDES